MADLTKIDSDRLKSYPSELRINCKKLKVDATDTVIKQIVTDLQPHAIQVKCVDSGKDAYLAIDFSGDAAIRAKRNKAEDARKFSKPSYLALELEAETAVSNVKLAFMEILRATKVEVQIGELQKGLSGGQIGLSTISVVEAPLTSARAAASTPAAGKLR